MNQALANKITSDSLLHVFEKKGYKMEIGAHYLNIVGVRAGTGFTNKFDDIVCVMYRGDGDKWVVERFEATVDPGGHYLLNPINPDGTGILVSGNYKGVWQIGLHQGKYEALVQRGLFRVYRDKDKDQEYDLDPKTIQSGSSFGLNCHHASNDPKYKSVVVANWSAACQVLAWIIEFNRLMELARTHRDVYGNSFDYTLLEEKDFCDDCLRRNSEFCKTCPVKRS